MATTYKGTPNRGLLGATLGFFAGFAAVVLFGPTANKFKDALHLTPLMIGFLVAIPSLSGSLLRIPFAAMVDITGGRKPFLTLLGLSLAGMVGLTYTTYRFAPEQAGPWMYWVLLFLGALSGCGIATFSVGISQVSYWFPRSRQGTALGVYAGVGNLAPGIFSFLLPVALSSWGLPGSYLAWLLFLAVGTILYYLTGLNSPYFQFRDQGMQVEEAQEQARKVGQELLPAGNLVKSLSISAKYWKTWMLVIIYFTTFGGFMALTAWLPTYWTSYLHVAALTAGALTGLYSILASVARASSGALADRLGGENTIIISLLTMLAGAALMVLSSSPALSITAEILMALGMGVSNAAVFKLVPQEVPQAVGGASGWVGGLGAFGGFVLPPVMGAIVRSAGPAGYASSFLLFVALPVIALSLAFILKRAHVAQKGEKPVPVSSR